MLGGLDYRTLLGHVRRLLSGNGIPIVQVIDSITDMKALAPPNGAVTYLVRGFAVLGDGGGGFYYWDAASVLADDGGIVIQLNTGGAGRFRKLL